MIIGTILLTVVFPLPGAPITLIATIGMRSQQENELSGTHAILIGEPGDKGYSLTEVRSDNNRGLRKDSITSPSPRFQMSDLKSHNRLEPL